MPLTINEDAFESCHENFLEFMKQNANGEPFTNFQHPFLVKDEIAYKWTAYNNGSIALHLDDWKKWKPGDGRTIQAVKNACLLPGVGANWLERRFGPKGNSDAPLYRVEGAREIQDLEEQLHTLMIGGADTPDALAPRFDAFADYLRNNHLSCKWPFVSHLAFLLRPTSYFPVKPARFNKLLAYYGLQDKVAGYVDWSRYSVLMQLADWLRERLSGYGTADIIEIHSYMWVVAYLGPATSKKRKRRPTRDFETELGLRLKRATERERRGLMGERFVFEHEVEQLIQLGKTKLAGQVEMVSVNCSEVGFDILSYDADGKEIHIEVKTTIGNQTSDSGFWLSESERARSQNDPSWRLYRVWSIDDNPHHCNLGNVVKKLPSDWQVDPCGWFVSHGHSNKAPKHIDPFWDKNLPEY